MKDPYACPVIEELYPSATDFSMVIPGELGKRRRSAGRRSAFFSDNLGYGLPAAALVVFRMGWPPE
jgi:hypothetical protein